MNNQNQIATRKITKKNGTLNRNIHFLAVNIRKANGTIQTRGFYATEAKVAEAVKSVGYQTFKNADKGGFAKLDLSTATKVVALN
jgi:hypothetical protein